MNWFISDRHRKPGKTVLATTVFLLLATVAVAQQNPALLQITSPADNTLVAPGQSVSVLVAAVSGVALTQVVVIGQNPFGFTNVSTSPPYQFSIMVPSKLALRKYLLTAFGTTPDGQMVQSQPTRLDVERPDLPTRISADRADLTFDSQGTQLPLHFFGTFSDGSFLDVTESSSVAYKSSNPLVAVIDSGGIVTAVGLGNCSVTATYTQGGQNVQVSVSITVPPQVVSLAPSTVAFSTQSVGTTSNPQSLIVTNTGNGSLSIITISTSGDFAETDNCIQPTVVPSGATCTINVSFKPSANGARSGSLAVATAASASPLLVTLSGSGVGPDINLTPASLTFSPQVVGSTSAAQSLSLINVGGAPLTVTKVNSSGDFATTDTCVSSSPIAPSGTCSISTKIRSGTISIIDNIAGSPQIVSLAGVGADFSLGVANGGSTNATVAAGQTAVYNLQLNSLGGLGGSVVLACTGAPTQATCSASSSAVTLSGSPSAFAVNVTTTARSIAPPGAIRVRLKRFPNSMNALAVASLLGLAAAILISARKSKTVSTRVLCGSLMFCLTMLMTSCAGGSGTGGPPPPTGGNSGTPAGTYTLTVTGSQQGLSHSQNLTLIVN